MPTNETMLADLLAKNAALFAGLEPIQAGVEYRRDTPESGLDLPYDTFYSSVDPVTGKRRRYRRTAEDPGYVDVGPYANPGDLGLDGLLAVTRAVSPYVAASGDTVAADTSAGSFTLTLPADGGIVVVIDKAGSWGERPLLIDGNGATIDGQAIFSADASGFSLTFSRAPGDGAWRYALNYQHGA